MKRVFITADDILAKAIIFHKYSTAKKLISGSKKIHKLYSQNNTIPKRKPYITATAFPPLNPANIGNQCPIAAAIPPIMDTNSTLKKKEVR